jgi:hypothetical protein
MAVRDQAGLSAGSEQDLAIAAEIQSTLLPKRIPQVSGFDWTAYYQPCGYVGGDYYDFIPLGPDHVGLVVADVSGKGLSGALVMVQVRTLMRAEARQTLSPAEALTRINRSLAGELPRGVFVTMIYAVLDVPRSEIVFCSAGHNPMLFWRHKNRQAAALNTSSLALGMDRGSRFDRSLRETRLPVDPGDRLLLYTDGLSEAMNLRDEEYGIARIGSVMRELESLDSSAFASQLLSRCRGFRRGAPQMDDLTLICGRRLAEPVPLRPEPPVACEFCSASNPKGERACRVCHEPLEPTRALRLTARKNELECPCGEIVKLSRDARGCRSCGRLLCLSCRRRFASDGVQCGPCVLDAPLSRSAR